MTIESRREVTNALLQEYREADLARKKILLDGLIASTGYSRKHAISLLNNQTRKTKPHRGVRKCLLSLEAQQTLPFLWENANRICSKRFVSLIPEAIENLEKFGHLSLSQSAKIELCSLSARTVDRVLKPLRDKTTRSLSFTRNSPLKDKVPIATFTHWKDVTPGYFEVDTVAHSSSDVNGPFLITLNMTDIATCWTMPFALHRKAGCDVVDALKSALDTTPFRIHGLDFDNGSEFLNDEVLSWCESQDIKYFRSRPYKKNDQCFVEEKNNSTIRREVGRERFCGDKSFKLLKNLYAVFHLYFNFFQPCQKLIEKHRDGAKAYKKHDKAQTPYARALESVHVSEECKQKLRQIYARLDMKTLHDQFRQLQEQLKSTAVDVPNPLLAALSAQRNATHIFTSKNFRGEVANTANTSLLRDTIEKLPHGTLVRPKDFIYLSSRIGIDCAFHRFVASGFLERTTRGVYRVKKQHEQEPYPKITILPGTILDGAMGI